jgi:hypothetical protein
MTTEIIVTEINNAVIIERKEPVVVSSQSQTQVVVGGMIGPTPTTISGLQDLDLSGLAAGSLLVYNAGNKKWVATNTLENQVFVSGQY